MVPGLKANFLRWPSGMRRYRRSNTGRREYGRFGWSLSSVKSA